jgi:hypothetical protein
MRKEFIVVDGEGGIFKVLDKNKFLSEVSKDDFVAICKNQYFSILLSEALNDMVDMNILSVDNGEGEPVSDLKYSLNVMFRYISKVFGKDVLLSIKKDCEALKEKWQSA